MRYFTNTRWITINHRCRIKRKRVPSAHKANFMNGVLNVASGIEYTKSQRAKWVQPNPIAGPKQEKYSEKRVTRINDHSLKIQSYLR